MGGVSVAGFLPGFGRGGTIHSFLVTMGGAGSLDAGATEAMLDAFKDLIAEVGGVGAGARAGGESAEEDVDIANDVDAMLSGRRARVKDQLKLTMDYDYVKRRRQ